MVHAKYTCQETYNTATKARSISSKKHSIPVSSCYVQGPSVEYKLSNGINGYQIYKLISEED